MAQLKGGHVADITSSMAEAMELALGQEWHAIKGDSLPLIGQDERRLLFVAIARGGGLQPRQIGPGARLRQRPGLPVLAAHDGRDEPLGLLRRRDHNADPCVKFRHGRERQQISA